MLGPQMPGARSEVAAAGRAPFQARSPTPRPFPAGCPVRGLVSSGHPPGRLRGGGRGGHAFPSSLDHWDRLQLSPHSRALPLLAQGNAPTHGRGGQAQAHAVCVEKDEQAVMTTAVLLTVCAVHSQHQPPFCTPLCVFRPG